jgi:MFS family permease
MAVDQEKSAELVARLERLPFSRWHRNFFVLAFFGIMLDAMDFALFGAALPPIAREFGLGPAQSGLLATVGLIGAFVGALFWGTFSDYIGRRTAFQATVGIFALFTGLMAATWNRRAKLRLSLRDYSAFAEWLPQPLNRLGGIEAQSIECLRLG